MNEKLMNILIFCRLHDSKAPTASDKVPSSIGESTLATIASTHPHKDSWPSWIKECVPELEKLHDLSVWKLVIWEWLELEHAMGYPSGKVRC